MILNNGVLKVNINSIGAEVKSIVKNDVEYMWKGDSEYWGRTSPVLFPIVGRLLDDEYSYDGKTYHLNQHGFARDNEFEVVSSSKKEISFLLRENDSTLKQYPFRFNLYINYALYKNGLKVTWIVENTSEMDMYFQIGSHPAFNFLTGSYIDINKRTNRYNLEGTPYVHSIASNLDVNSIEVSDETFKKDAIIFDNIDRVNLRDKDKSVIVECEGFPYIGFWSKIKNSVNAPFVCIEPWHGIADCTFHNKKLTEKKGINVLKALDRFEASYKIIVK